MGREEAGVRKCQGSGNDTIRWKLNLRAAVSILLVSQAREEKRRDSVSGVIE